MRAVVSRVEYSGCNRGRRGRRARSAADCCHWSEWAGRTTSPRPARWRARSTSCASSPADDGARVGGRPRACRCSWSASSRSTPTRARDAGPPGRTAAPGEVAEPLVEEVVAELRRRGCTVATGVFGAADAGVVGQRRADDPAAGGLSDRHARRVRDGVTRTHSLRFAVNRPARGTRAPVRTVVQDVPHRTEEPGAGPDTPETPGT